MSRYRLWEPQQLACSSHFEAAEDQRHNMLATSGFTQTRKLELINVPIHWITAAAMHFRGTAHACNRPSHSTNISNSIDVQEMYWNPYQDIFSWKFVSGIITKILDLFEDWFWHHGYVDIIIEPRRFRTVARCESDPSNEVDVNLQD